MNSFYSDHRQSSEDRYDHYEPGTFDHQHSKSYFLHQLRLSEMREIQSQRWWKYQYLRQQAQRAWEQKQNGKQEAPQNDPQ